MPGLCLRYDRPGRSSSPEEFAAALDSARHFDRDRVEIHRDGTDGDGDGCAVGSVGYPSYPVRFLTGESYDYYLEGELYDTASVEDELRSLARALFDDGRDDDVTEWIRTTDGDFVVCVRERSSGEVAILNDLFARLPLYYAVDRERVVVARDVGCVLDHLSNPAFDRLGIAQHLALGFPVGTRTLWSDVRRVDPATVVRLSPDGVSFERRQTFDFDGAAHRGRSVEENASNLASLFVDACRGRCSRDGTTVVSLSGGHDSRAVAAGLSSSGHDRPVVAATFERESNGADVDVARRVAGRLDMEWGHYRVDAAERADLRTMVDIKRGLNPIGMGFILDFFEEIRERHGPNVTYVTGDGGDKALPSLAPSKPLGSTTDLVDFLLAKHRLFPMDEVTALTGLDEADVRESIRTVVADYPESSFENRYVHFLVHERGFNWLFEGEDRNRHYFWSVSPFYSPAFFRYAMNVPDEQKAHNRLYRAFLERLWPEAVEIPDANFGTPMSSPRYGLYTRGMALLERYPVLWDLAKSVSRGETGEGYDEEIAQLVAAQVRECDAVGDYLVPEAVADVVTNRDSYGSKQAYNLLTITSAIDAVDGSEPVLERSASPPVQ